MPKVKIIKFMNLKLNTNGLIPLQLKAGVKIDKFLATLTPFT